MNTEKSIGKMTKAELLDVISSIPVDLDQLKNLKDQLDEATNGINQINSFDFENINSQISSINETAEKSGEINDLRNSLLVDNEEDGTKSVKTEISELNESAKQIVAKTQNAQKDQKTFSKQVQDFLIKRQGQIADKEKKLDSLIKSAQDTKKYIEQKLKAGATSAVLSKSFSDKVKEFEKKSEIWTKIFMLSIGLATVGLGSIVYFGVLANNIKELSDYLIRFLFITPVFGLVIWMVMFCGNRRAENKKLEESYKHKELMARSFLGYREHIKELSKTDKEEEDLIKKHMSDLLKAIAKDSSEFIRGAGEGHPLLSRPWDHKKSDSTVSDEPNILDPNRSAV